MKAIQIQWSHVGANLPILRLDSCLWRACLVVSSVESQDKHCGGSTTQHGAGFARPTPRNLIVQVARGKHVKLTRATFKLGGCR